ncbi:MAG TPA: ABC transporter ATP-binding protein [Syntrophobacteraceae bacterium]|nr:ABC transporter ATP-binding protein [Syntrophobacteraceae bacterium]
MLEIVDLSFHYGSSTILRGIAAHVPKGRILCVAGPNGAGKTTLLRCLTGIARPSGGQILIEGREVLRMTRRELATRVGYVPQHRPSGFPMTVFETVLMGRRPHLTWRPSARDLELTADILRELNLEDLAMRDLDRLSGGQAQKVMLARALAQEPSFLVLDEPTSSLDLCHQLEVMEMVQAVVGAGGMGAVIALHDLNLAARFADEIMLLKDGRVFARGEPSVLIGSENIREVYRVDADVRMGNGRPWVQPLRCVR